MTNYKLDRNAKYTDTHEWVRMQEDLAVVGISDAAQDLLSDVVFVELPAVGDEVAAGDSVAVVESVKAAEEIIAPVSGVVAEINSELEDTPEVVNDAPYEAWFFKIRPTEKLQAELDALMDPDVYDSFVEESEH